MGQRSELIPAALEDERVDRVVSMATGISRRQAADLIEAGAVTVNGTVATARSQRLAENDMLVVDVPDEEPGLPLADADVAVDVVWEDSCLAVVDKPAGLVVHPGAGNPEGTLVNGLLARYRNLGAVGEPHRPGIVHRLDRGTTGLMVVALTQVAYLALVEAMAERRVERGYLALVWGELVDDRGTIDSPIGRSMRHPARMTVTPRGKPARTHYEVVKRYFEPAPSTLVGCRLDTGRTHQIRVHMSAIGHPVVGDVTYGGAREGIEFPRPALHAARLGLDHPTTGTPLEFESPTPPDLSELLARLR